MVPRMRVLPASEHDQYRPEVQGGEQLQIVGILRNAANDVRGELLEQQRLVGGGVGWAAVRSIGPRSASRASAAASAGLLWARVWWRMVPSGASRRTWHQSPRPRARARTAGSHAASGIVDEELICRLVGLVRA